MRVSWHTENPARPGNCKVLPSLTTQTDTKYLKSYCKSVSYRNLLHDLMEITVHFKELAPNSWGAISMTLLALSKALPGWAAQHNLQALPSGAKEHSDSARSHGGPLHLLSLQEELKITILGGAIKCLWIFAVQRCQMAWANWAWKVLLAARVPRVTWESHTRRKSHTADTKFRCRVHTLDGYTN